MTAPYQRELADSMLGDPDSPYLLTDEAARYLRFNSPALFRKWAQRNRVPVQRRGRTLLYDRAVLDAFLMGKRWTRVHAPQSAVSRCSALGEIV